MTNDFDSFMNIEPNFENLESLIAFASIGALNIVLIIWVCVIFFNEDGRS